MRIRAICSSLALGCLCAAAGAPALSGEKGHYTGLAVLNSTKFTELKSPEGHPGKSVMCGELEGLMFNDDKKPFLDKAHYIVQYVIDGNNWSSCNKTFTMKDGDKVFARCESRNTSSGDGTLILVGGTGKYAGIRGSGTFKFRPASGAVNWDVLEIDYEIP